MRRAAAAALAIATTLAPGVPAGAHELPDASIVAGPGAFATTYTTRALVVRAGAPLRFLNADLLPLHAVEASASFTTGQPWCDGYQSNRCPLFWSELTTPNGGSKPVLNGTALVAGRAYPFTCRVFEDMEGVLIAV